MSWVKIARGNLQENLHLTAMLSWQKFWARRMWASPTGPSNLDTSRNTATKEPATALFCFTYACSSELVSLYFIPMSERIYVAASFEQREEVRVLHERLKAEGHAITADWTTHKEIVSLESEEEREALKRQYAIEDTDGVTTASVYALLLGSRKSTGAHIELGIGCRYQVARICLIGEVDESQLFYSHPSIITVPNADAFIDLLSSH